MSRAATALLLLALARTALAGCEDCRWAPVPQSIMLGEALELSVTRPRGGAGAPLAELPLDGLQADFELFERIVGHGAAEEDMRLVLYPRRAGTLPLALPGVAARAVEVRDDGPVRVEFAWHAEPANWTLRRAHRLVLEACTRGALRWRRPEAAFTTGLTLTPLDTPLAHNPPATRDCVAQRWAWSATPSLAGALRVDLAMLEANRQGRRMRFPAPLFHAEVADVPAWLPAGIAVGEPQVVQTPPAAQAHVGEPLVWRLQLRAGYSKPALLALLDAQLAGSAAWARYPPQIEPLRADEATPVWDIRLTAMPHTHGSLALPPLRLPWFDAQAGVLRHTLVEAAPIAVGDPARERLIRAGWRLAVALLLLAAGWMARGRMQGWLAHHRLIAQVAASADANALHAALVGARPAATAQAWARTFLQSRTAPELPGLATELDALRFGQRPSTNFATLRARLGACLRGARRIRVGDKPSPSGATGDRRSASPA